MFRRRENGCSPLTAKPSKSKWPSTALTDSRYSNELSSESSGEPKARHKVAGRRAPKARHKVAGRRAPKARHKVAGRRAPKARHKVAGRRAPKARHKVARGQGERSEHAAPGSF